MTPEEREELRAVRRAARWAAIGWWTPWLVVAFLVGVSGVLYWRPPWPVTVGGTGLVLDVFGIWMLARGVIFVTNPEIAAVGTLREIGGEQRRSAMIMGSEEGKLGVVVATIGFVLQFVGLLLSIGPQAS